MPVAAILFALTSAACTSGTSVASAEPSPPPTAEATEAPEATERPTTEPTPTPSAEPSTFAVGDVITITQGGEAWADFTVVEVQEASEFIDPDGFANDTPQIQGYVYLTALVRYEALTDGVDYNPFDFQVFVDGQAVEGFAFALNGPEPQLSSGTLPAGRSAEGWLIYEVPATGEVLLSYGNTFLDEPPVFEVVLRED